MNVRAMRNMVFGLTVNKLAVLKMLVSREFCRYEFSFQMIRQRTEACPKETTPQRFSQPGASLSLSQRHSQILDLPSAGSSRLSCQGHGLSGDCMN